MLEKAAGHDVSVLLRGESGTGKGVLARALHACSPRRDRPFVVVNCPTLSDELLASELFGHARGAFTGAVRDQPGRVEAAEGGTLFLDEIGEISPGLQAKLLRFLQEKQFERVGETRTRTADVRIVAATNRDLEAEVQAGRFREDLLYRLNVIEVAVPPLRERPEDILALARRFLAFFAPRPRGRSCRRAPSRRCSPTPGPATSASCATRIERAVILSPGRVLEPESLPERIAAHGGGGAGARRRLTPRRDRARAHPARAGARPDRRGGGAHPGDRRVDLVAQAQEVRPLTSIRSKVSGPGKAAARVTSPPNRP